MKSKKLGQFVLLKYCTLSVAIGLAWPLLLSWIYQIFSDGTYSFLTFYENILKDLGGNIIFITIQIFVLLSGIWLIGGAAGRLILERNKPKFLVGGLTLLLLWILLFTSSALTAAIESSIKWGGEGFLSAIIDWIIYGLLLFILLGIAHGILMGYLIGSEIKFRGQK